MAQRVNITDRVYSHLREAIVSGELKPGSLHSIYRLADELGFSRTPVREAVLRLADTGMVAVERNRGFRIRGLTVDDIREVFEFRLMIEVPAAAYAATHGGEEMAAALQREIDAMHAAAVANDGDEFRSHDRALHDVISAITDNQRLSVVLATLRDATRARGAWTAHRTRDLSEIESEHTPIVAALLARDPVAAAAQMRVHLVRTGTLLMQQVAETSGESVPESWADRLTGSSAPRRSATKRRSPTSLE